jgi:2-succinyl-5-enolpyruvyl-6-hydroxy-3-cyclohexene-1-carboxylate synthase
VVVVTANGGGQIFAALGQGNLPPEELERYFVTPSGVDLEMLCRAAGAGHSRVERSSAFVPTLRDAAAAGGVQIIQVEIDAERDRARRAELETAAAAAIDATRPPIDSRS